MNLMNQATSMRNDFENLFLKDLGEDFTVVRGAMNIGSIRGCTTTKNTVQFKLDADIQAGDWITGTVSNQCLYVLETKFELFEGERISLVTLCQSKLDHDREQNAKVAAAGPIFNIKTAVNSIIGTQHNAHLTVNYSFDQIREMIELKGDTDKSDLHNMVNLLEHITKGNLPAKHGMLEKYSSLIEKHSWITSPLASLCLGWLFGAK